MGTRRTTALHALQHLATWGLAALASSTWAAKVTGVTPQGEVPHVREVRVAFEGADLPGDDLRAPAPFTLRCNGQDVRGNGYWNLKKQWVFDLEQPLGAGSRCELQPSGKLKLEGNTRFTFSTGGPALAQVWPGEYQAIEEQQNFLVRLTGPASVESVRRFAWCEQEGVGDRIGLQVVTGAPREALLKRYQLAAVADRTLMLACDRPFAPGSKVRLVWGAGIAASSQTSLVNRAQDVRNWTVRERFEASMSCERERAQAPCMPLRPIRLSFNANVPRELALAVRLVPEGGGGALAPSLQDDTGSSGPSNTVSELHFPSPLPVSTRFKLVLPAGLKDESGRALANASSFPLGVATGAMPPLAKFAAAPFGILEAGPDTVLPITVRHVQADLRGGGTVRVKRLDASVPDEQLLQWMARLQKFHESTLSPKEAGVPASMGRIPPGGNQPEVASREVSLLTRETDTRKLTLPSTAAPEPSGSASSPAEKNLTEVMGLPLTDNGYHLVEVESKLLGKSLLAKAAPMYVRTGVLVTQMGVHFKKGRENSLVWVTTLDRARPVAGAQVAVNDCQGHTVWQGQTDERGVAHIPRGFNDDHNDCLMRWAWFVTARKTDAAGRTDLSFMFSDWHDGVEPWRFDLPTASGSQLDERVHTVLDRTLFRAGETVSMKHFFRVDTSRGLSLPAPRDLPTHTVIHGPGGSEVKLPLQWKHGSASAQWAIPATAKLGSYQISLGREGDSQQQWWSSEFRVEAFRLPVLDARMSPPAGDVIAPKDLALDVSLAWRNGGGLAKTPGRVSALLRTREPDWESYSSYQFLPAQSTSDFYDPDETYAAEDSDPTQQLVADRLALTTDGKGSARVQLKNLPAVQRPMMLVAELEFNDPNGEVQTVTRNIPVWPAARMVGIQAQSWASSGSSARVKTVVINPRGQAIGGHPVVVKARQVQWITTRKRMVGGFYAYDQREEVKDLGTVCEGKSDERGLFECEAPLKANGQVQLQAEVRDDAGRVAQAGTTVWVSTPGNDTWFPQDNDDRIELVPEQRELQPGQTARLQVRMPFRQATALVTVEREGILHSEVVSLSGDRPVIEVKIPGGRDAVQSWAPNVYVSALVVRGRVREVPWYSFFQWGWRTPLEWWNAWRHENPQWQPPTAMVDLAKPSFKLGVTSLKIGLADHALKVDVQTDKAQYGVRQVAKVTLNVTRNGAPVAGAHVAFAAVDEALLALRDNPTWDLLGAMMTTRPWGVETSTAQGEIIGRRHHGRKALPAGGGGGMNPTRELFDTLLLWRPDVVTDAQGRATLEVPLNDSLTRFRFVAIADASGAAIDGETLADRFGTGHANVTVSQDVQLLAGLPLAAREGDQFEAGFTVRNGTSKPMSLDIVPQVTVEGVGTPATLKLAARQIELAAGQSQEVSWPVEVPVGAQRLRWALSAKDRSSGAQDKLALQLPIFPAVPVQAWQAQLQQIGPEGLNLSMTVPSGALLQPGQTQVARGGVQVMLQPSLAGALPGVQRFFEAYPFSCLEQRSSRAVGLADEAAWRQVTADLPGYLDADGLAHYYPPPEGSAARGSDRLTAYLVALAHESGQALPPQELTRMLGGLTAFVEGRLERRSYGPKSDLDVRKLAAIEALSRHNQAYARQLGSIQIVPAQWPTAALIDWWNLLRRVKDIPERERLMAEAGQLLRARLVATSTSLRFTTEDSDLWWWLMDSPDANAARLILAAMEQPDWRADLPMLLQGALARQQRGAWLTTTANAWGTLAVRQFARRFERQPVAGRTELAWGTASASQRLDWRAKPEGGTVMLPWPSGGTGSLNLRHNGNGQPWALVQSMAAVPLTSPVSAGYTLRRSVQPVLQQVPGRWSRGDVLRIKLDVEARADMSWVGLSDPLPAGATVLGNGLGRDSALLAASGAEAGDGAGNAALTYIERAPEAWRGVMEWLPRGKHQFSYTVRLNNSGRFALPPSRIEAMYAPATFAEVPNAVLEVAPK